MGDSSANLQALADNAKVIEGKRFGRISTLAAIKKWAEEVIK